MFNIEFDISAYPQQFAKICEYTRTTLLELGVSEVSIWGAGETGKLIYAVLSALNVKVCHVYDTHLTGTFYGHNIQLPPIEKLSSEFIVVAIAANTNGFKNVVKILQSLQCQFMVYAKRSSLEDYTSIVDETTTKIKSEQDAPLKHTLQQSTYRLFRDTRIAQFKDRHQGETGVILGNGPSLLQTDLGLIQGLPTIGLNKIFKLFDKTDFRPTYLCSYIKDVVSQCLDQFKLLTQTPIFIAHECLDILPPDYEHIYYLGPHKQHSFSLDPVSEICCGFTVSYVAMQLAYFMGFEKVILVGMDHNYAGYNGEGDQWQRISEPKAMHFDPEYFSSGQFWQTPNFLMMENSFRFAKSIFEYADREIVDATIGGKLTVFRKMDLKDAVNAI